MVIWKVLLEILKIVTLVPVLWESIKEVLNVVRGGK